MIILSCTRDRALSIREQVQDTCVQNLGTTFVFVKLNNMFF
jgi:hypothetical protein